MGSATGWTRKIETGSPTAATQRGDGAQTRGERGERQRLASSVAGGAGATRYAHPYFWAPFILVGNWR